MEWKTQSEERRRCNCACGHRQPQKKKKKKEGGDDPALQALRLVIPPWSVGCLELCYDWKTAPCCAGEVHSTDDGGRRKSQQLIYSDDSTEILSKWDPS